jgi:peptidoglycan/xylan/chitin deacetylase (PgdA/CDA1 family)
MLFQNSRRKADMERQMNGGKTLIVAASFFFFAAAFAINAEPQPAAVPQTPQPYAPKPERFEILKGWEKPPGAKQPPEIVAGIYERDYGRYDFENEIAITIDDAAPNRYLEAELDILKKYRVKAVFFIIGSYFVSKTGKPLSRAKELLDRIVAEGHEIGSHTYRHLRLDEGKYRDNEAAIGAELDKNQAVIDTILGYHYPIRYFRPPNGAHSTPRYAVDRAVLARGMYLTNWTITSFDWNIRYEPDNPEHLEPEKVIARTIKQAREDSGGVVLLHGFGTTAAILDELLGDVAAASNKKGRLGFSTLDELLRLKYE